MIRQESKTIFATLALIATLFVTSACTPTLAQRGNMLEDHQVAEVTVGESTRSDVLRNLGSPTTQSTFNSNVWYYIGQETEKRGILDPEVIEERIFLVAFTDEGVLETLEEVDRERMNIPYVRKKTKTYGNETGVLQQFLGNLGKFNPQQAQ
jgi:outer membrane protein assembly factor BamE (lipoprotein component of BamABCDE complex)